VPTWCSTTTSGPTTFTQGANSWADDFNHGLTNASMGAGYRVFERVGNNHLTQHFRHNDHWMVDVAGRDQTPADGPWDLGGATMRPDRSFRFQNGTLVIEADAAAGITEYDGAAWPELVVTTAPAPTSNRQDGIYNYDAFAGHHTLGCRLQDNRQPICAFFDNTPRGPGQGGRVFEISHFQNGTSSWGEGASYKWGGDPSIAGLGQAWRVCRGTDPDLNCRDRFRWEISQDRFLMYVNGTLYMEHRGFPAAQQLPAAFLNGEVYVYFGSWIFKPGVDTVRFHWDRVAVNPADTAIPPGSPAADGMHRGHAH
jgi:hypothetical protein